MVKLLGKFNGYRNTFYSDVFRLKIFLLLNDLYLMFLGRGINLTQSVSMSGHYLGYAVSYAVVLFFCMSSIKTGHFFALVIVVLQLVQFKNLIVV